MEHQKSEKNTGEGIIKTPTAESQDAVDVAAVEQPATGSYSGAGEKPHESRAAGTAGLSVILGYMVAYFSDRADVDDLDTLSFSLHHLFCQVDSLYRLTLPQLLERIPPRETEQSPRDELLQRQATWSELRSIKYTLGRMDPLCNLLSDATRCMLDALDRTGGSSPEAYSNEPLSLNQDQEPNWLQVLNHERWEQALSALTECLHAWQECSNQVQLFSDHFAQIAPPIADLPQLDAAFSIILDSTGAIFGDILPSFQAISAGDDDAVAMLLFDLMQQADQLLVQFDIIIEPLHTLIEHFALLLQR